MEVIWVTVLEKTKTGYREEDGKTGNCVDLSLCICSWKKVDGRWINVNISFLRRSQFVFLKYNFTCVARGYR